MSDALTTNSSTLPAPAAGRDQTVAYVEVSVLAAIFVLALGSNTLVLIALGRQLRRKPSSRMYRLMYHLSIADLLVAVLHIFPQLSWDITHRYERDRGAEKGENWEA